jgi:N-glycosidase YbiA
MQGLVIFGKRKGDPFSNFAYCDIAVRCPFCNAAITAKTVEHAFQAAKATSCRDYHYVVFAPGPSMARDLGKQIRLRSDWEQRAPQGNLSVKATIMLDLLRQKYAQEPFKQLLLDTDFCIIIENAPWDKNWGAGKNGRGTNALGRLLMVVRSELRGCPIPVPPQTPFVKR